MKIINSSQALLKVIDLTQFSTIYVEDNFPIQISGTFRMPPAEAAEFLIGSATVGSKALGLFHEIPKLKISRPFRAVCIFIVLKLPSEINVPIFFCKTHNDIAEMYSKAFKISMDTNMPVIIVISPNTLNNYGTKEILTETQDRVQPYITQNAIDSKRLPQQIQEKLSSAYSALAQSSPYRKSDEKVSFLLTKEYFPEYIFPIVTEEQVDLFKSKHNLHTTATEIDFLHLLVNGLLGLKISISADLPEPRNCAKTFLCPGCPFKAIFSAPDINDYIVFSSVRCPAVQEMFPVNYASCAEYAGMSSQKANVKTLFIGNISEINPFIRQNPANATFIALQDNKDKPVSTLVSAPNKFRQITTCTFPYSCINIKKYKTIKINEKKCNCAKLGIAPACQDTHCPAILADKEIIRINENICTGCRLCVASCPSKAIS